MKLRFFRKLMRSKTFFIDETGSKLSVWSQNTRNSLIHSFASDSKNGSNSVIFWISLHFRSFAIFFDFSHFLDFRMKTKIPSWIQILIRFVLKNCVPNNCCVLNNLCVQKISILFYSYDKIEFTQSSISEKKLHVKFVFCQRHIKNE